MKKIEYKGWITTGSNGEEDEIITLGGSGDDRSSWLAELIEMDIEDYGSFLTVRYFISDKESGWDRLNEEFIKTIVGFGSAEYAMVYSEYTGYLWTDESIKVGGHQLLNELYGNCGRYLHMKITYTKEDKTADSEKCTQRQT